MSTRIDTPLHLTRDHAGGPLRPERHRGLRRVRHGVYVRDETWRKLPPWERYRLRVEAVAQTWTSPVLCLESAAVRQGLPIFGEPSHIHLLSPDGSSWREGDVVVHGSRDARALVVDGGVTMTAPLETAVDLCRVLPPAFALAVADALLRDLGIHGLGVDVSAHGRGQANRRGLRRLDWVQARATGLAESPGESVSRAAIEWLGYAAPVLQHEFRYEGARDRCDFFWPAERVIGESDGYGKYDPDDADAARRQVIAEKRREDRLRRHVRGVARWDWADAVRAAPLDAALRAAGLRPVSAPTPSLLATLSSHPRSLPQTRDRAMPPRRRATPPVSA